jgi:hypothetical protein
MGNCETKVIAVTGRKSAQMTAAGWDRITQVEISTWFEPREDDLRRIEYQIINVVLESGHVYGREIYKNEDTDAVALAYAQRGYTDTHCFPMFDAVNTSH